MNKCIGLGLSLVLSLLSLQAMANKITYKCHLEYIKQGVTEDTIVKKRIDPIIEKALVASLQTSSVYAPDGVTSYKVKKVIECVPEFEKFTSAVSRDLERKTPQ